MGCCNGHNSFQVPWAKGLNLMSEDNHTLANGLDCPIEELGVDGTASISGKAETSSLRLFITLQEQVQLIGARKGSCCLEYRTGLRPSLGQRWLDSEMTLRPRPWQEPPGARASAVTRSIPLARERHEFLASNGHWSLSNGWTRPHAERPDFR